MVFKYLALLAVTVFLGVGCAGDKYNRSTGEVFDDTAISSKVKAEMLADPDVKGLAVKVNVNKGNVQLSGFVDTPAQKERAGNIAKNVKGVQYVKNDLIVKQ